MTRGRPTPGDRLECYQPVRSPGAPTPPWTGTVTAVHGHYCKLRPDNTDHPPVRVHLGACRPATDEDARCS